MWKRAEEKVKMNVLTGGERQETEQSTREHTSAHSHSTGNCREEKREGRQGEGPGRAGGAEGVCCHSITWKAEVG